MKKIIDNNIQRKTHNTLNGVKFRTDEGLMNRVKDKLGFPWNYK